MNQPLEEYTLMPTHMRGRFSPKELENWKRAPPFGFTKNVPLIHLSAKSRLINPWAHGTLPFDLNNDPNQIFPVQDDERELYMLRLLAKLMHESEAPESQFTRLGIPFEHEPGYEHLLVKKHAQRAAAMAVPIPPLNSLPASDLLANPIIELLEVRHWRSILEQKWPEISKIELANVVPATSIYGLAARAVLTVQNIASALA